MLDSVFAPEEFEQRLTRIRAELKRRDVDALIATRRENIYYGSGFRAAHFASWLSEFHALVVPVAGEPRLMTRALEKAAAMAQFTKEPLLYRDHENAYDVLAAILKESGKTATRLGIEERHIRLSQYKKLKEHFPEAQFIDVTGLIEDVAASPSQAELACLRRAAAITAIGLETGLREAKEGRYPYEVIGRIHEAMYCAGQADFDMSLVAVWSGPEGGRMHDTSTTERIRQGDLVTIEIMGVDNQYQAGSQTCLYVGEGAPPKPVADAYKLVTAMHSEARRAVKAGKTAGDIFEAASSVYRAAKGTDYYRRCGGSMGLTLFTLDLVKDRKDVLKPGTPLLIQVLVDDPVLLTCANTVIVTEDGCEELTQPVLDLQPRL